MKKEKEQIKQEILAHINKEGGAKSSWYVGITQNIEQRLFGDHKVQKENAWYAFREAMNSTEAREIEKYFIETIGTDGGTGGGDNDASWVYAYKKTSQTDP